MTELQPIIDRLEALERVVFGSGSLQRDPAVTSDYSGPQGGIRQLVDTGYFGSPRDLASVRTKLEEIGYVYPRQSINNALGRSSRPGSLLVSIKRGGKKTYVNRK